MEKTITFQCVVMFVVVQDCLKLARRYQHVLNKAVNSQLWVHVLLPNPRKHMIQPPDFPSFLSQFAASLLLYVAWRREFYTDSFYTGIIYVIIWGSIYTDLYRNHLYIYFNSTSEYWCAHFLGEHGHPQAAQSLVQRDVQCLVLFLNFLPDVNQIVFRLVGQDAMHQKGNCAALLSRRSPPYSQNLIFIWCDI